MPGSLDVLRYDSVRLVLVSSQEIASVIVIHGQRDSMVHSELIRIRTLISIIDIHQDKALTLGWMQLSFPAMKRLVPNIT